MTRRCSSMLVILLLWVYAGTATAQVNPVVAEVSVTNAVVQQPVKVRVELLQSTGIRHVSLYYRAFGTSEYDVRELIPSGTVAETEIPGVAVDPPSLEYWIEVELVDGARVTYPEEAPEVNPLQVAVADEIKPGDIVRVLSPEPNTMVAAEDVAVAISLYFTPEEVDRSATRLLLDDRDVTGQATLSGDLLLFHPGRAGTSLGSGSHTLQVVLYDHQGDLFHSAVSPFVVRSSEVVAEHRQDFKMNGQAESSWRSESIRGSSEAFLRGTYRLDGSYGNWRFGGEARLDNRPGVASQPSNRYSAFLSTSWLRLDVGDMYPSGYSRLMVSGQRVRGVDAELHLGFFNLDVTYGQAARNVEGVVYGDTTFASPSAAGNRPLNSRPREGLTYEFFNSGTYSRNILIVRPSFGGGRKFQLGFTYLKATDDKSSIVYGSHPKENLALGSDLLVALFDQRLRWKSEASLSVVNNDVSPGSFGDAFVDSLDVSEGDRDLLRKGLDVGSRFITINENINGNPVGEGLPGVSAESELTLNVLNNYVQANYFRRGANYTSFANRYMQTDIEGVRLSDRIRLFSNRVFTTLSYEKKWNNTAKTRPGTTEYESLNGSVALNTNPSWPNVTVGYGLLTRMSDVVQTSPDGLLETLTVDDAGTRYFGSLNYSVKALGQRHGIATSFSLLDRDDKSYYDRDQDNLNLLVGLTTTWQVLPLRTMLRFQRSANESQYTLYDETDGGGYQSRLLTTPFSYSSFSLGGDYQMSDLRLRGSAAYTTGDLKRVALEGAFAYSFLGDHEVELRTDYRVNSGYDNDFIMRLVYRANFRYDAASRISIVP